MQGLYEYVKPKWQPRARPKVDDEKVKSFGQNVAPRPLNPDEKQALVYPVAMEIDGVKTPRLAKKQIASNIDDNHFFSSNCIPHYLIRWGVLANFDHGISFEKFRDTCTCTNIH